MRYDGRGAVIRPDILRAAAAIPCVTTAVAPRSAAAVVPCATTAVAPWSGGTSSAAG